MVASWSLLRAISIQMTHWLPTHIVPVYNGRIFLPCGVYSQRMQSAQDVIALVPSAQYAQDTARHVSTVCGW